MIKNIEVVTIKHKEISIRVGIDYDQGTVSLLETNSTVKKWIFGARSLPYMQSWLNIMEAMQEGVKYGKRMLEKHLAEETKFKNKIIKQAKSNG